MGTYSTYDYTTKLYTYWEGAGPGGTHAGAPPIRAHKPLGASPDQASWLLPVGARKVGTGALPRGRIATIGGGALGDIGESSTGKIALLAGAAYLAWRYLR